MSANLITGNLFSPITAAQDSDFQAGILGDSTYIMPVGNQMALTIVDANTISAADGVIVTKEGRRIQIDTGGTETFTIPTGTVGTTAYYIIGFHLYTDANTSAELCETFVEAVENSTDRITENTFKGGYTEIYVSLGLVTQDGINLDSVTSLLSVGSTLKQLNSNLGEKIGFPDYSNASDFETLSSGTTIYTAVAQGVLFLTISQTAQYIEKIYVNGKQIGTIAGGAYTGAAALRFPLPLILDIGDVVTTSVAASSSHAIQYSFVPFK